MIKKTFILLIAFCGNALAGNDPICITGNAVLQNSPINFSARFYVYGLKGSVRSVVGKVCSDTPPLRICYPSNGSLSVVDNKILISTQGNDFIAQANGLVEMSTGIQLDPTTLNGTFGSTFRAIGNANNQIETFIKGTVNVSKCGPESDVDKKTLINGLNNARKASK